MLRDQPIRLGARLAHGELLIVYCAPSTLQRERLIELFQKFVHQLGERVARRIVLRILA